MSSSGILRTLEDTRCEMLHVSTQSSRKTVSLCNSSFLFQNSFPCPLRGFSPIPCLSLLRLTVNSLFKPSLLWLYVASLIIVHQILFPRIKSKSDGDFFHLLPQSVQTVTFQEFSEMNLLPPDIMDWVSVYNTVLGFLVYNVEFRKIAISSNACSE